MGTIFYRNKAYGGGSGGSSGGGGITRTVLFDAGGGGIWMDSQGKTFELTDDIDNYDEIEVIAFTMEGDNNYYYTTVQKFAVEDLMVPHVADRFRGMRFRVLVERSTGTDVSIFSVVLESQDPDETAKRTIVCEGASGILGACIHKVIGIKYASGGGGGGSYKDITATLQTGDTTVTISDSSITENSALDFYTDTYGVYPIDASYNTLTESLILTFEPQDVDVTVKVRVS